jgi:hypothetical protein
MFGRWILKGVVALVAVVGLGVGVTKAGDTYCPPQYVYVKVVSYENVTVYETRSEAYTVCVTKYDHCGYPYSVYETRYRDVKYPVTKQVAVTKYVKVPAS